jgi:hypothetical protein
MTSAPSRSLTLTGRFVEYGEATGGGALASARRIGLPLGRVVLALEHEDPDDGWSMRLSSSDGRSFLGTLRRSDGGTEHPVAMTMWRAPDDEDRWLLVGTWTDEDGGEIAWSIELAPERG